MSRKKVFTVLLIVCTFGIIFYFAWLQICRTSLVHAVSPEFVRDVDGVLEPTENIAVFAYDDGVGNGEMTNRQEPPIGVPAISLSVPATLSTTAQDIVQMHIKSKKFPALMRIGMKESSANSLLFEWGDYRVSVVSIDANTLICDVTIVENEDFDGGTFRVTLTRSYESTETITAFSNGQIAKPMFGDAPPSAPEIGVEIFHVRYRLNSTVTSINVILTSGTNSIPIPLVKQPGGIYLSGPLVAVYNPVSIPGVTTVVVLQSAPLTLNVIIP